MTRGYDGTRRLHALVIAGRVDGLRGTVRTLAERCPEPRVGRHVLPLKTTGTTIMSNTARDLFITGLKNAHAMESQAHEILERQVERMDKYPELVSQLRQHLTETKEQVKRLEQCLEQLDSSPSTFKDTVLAFGSNIAAIGHAMAGDEVLKNTFADSGLENYEIAAYRSLIALSEAANAGMKTVLDQSLHEEERMAAWIECHVQQITLQYLKNEEREAA